MTTSEKNNEIEIKTFVVGPLETNCYLVHEKKSGKGMLIDPGTHSPAITDYANEKGIDVICTVNTHGHADHITGNAAFGFPVFIHEFDAACLTDPARNLSMFIEGKVTPMRAQRLLADGEHLELGDVMCEIIHTPGHTPGSISMRYKDILFSGDTLFCEGIGRTDMPEGDYGTIVNSIKKKLFVLPDNVEVFPGHGPKTTIAHEKAANKFL